MRMGKPLESDASKLFARAEETGSAQNDAILSSGVPARKSPRAACWLAASFKRRSSRARGLALWIVPEGLMITSASPLESKTALNVPSAARGGEGCAEE